MIQRLKTDEEVYQTRDDLEMMRRTRLWPGPSLCLKMTFPKWRSAVLARNGEHYVFESAEGEIRRGRDELLVELVKEGWLVD